MVVKPRGTCDGCGQLRALNPAFGKSYCAKCLAALPDQPVTPGQLAFLRDLGVALPENIGRDAASELITRALNSLPATAAQLEYLAVIGSPIPANLSRQKASELLDLVTPIRYYALAFCRDFYQRARLPNRRFVAANPQETTEEFLERQSRIVSRMVLAEPVLFMSVQQIEETRERNGGDVPRDAVYDEIKRRLATHSSI